MKPTLLNENKTPSTADALEAPLSSLSTSSSDSSFSNNDIVNTTPAVPKDNKIVKRNVFRQRKERYLANSDYAFLGRRDACAILSGYSSCVLASITFVISCATTNGSLAAATIAAECINAGYVASVPIGMGMLCECAQCSRGYDYKEKLSNGRTVDITRDDYEAALRQNAALQTQATQIMMTPLASRHMESEAARTNTKDVVQTNAVHASKFCCKY